MAPAGPLQNMRMHRALGLGTCQKRLTVVLDHRNHLERNCIDKGRMGNLTVLLTVADLR